MTPQNKKNRINQKVTGMQRTNKLVNIVAPHNFALSNECMPAPIQAVWTAVAQDFSDEENQRRKQENTR